MSAASIWEISIKTALGKLRIPAKYRDILEGQGFRELPITWRHAQSEASLPEHHRDPFDRILVAQALCEGLTLLSTDEQIKKYDAAVK